MTLAFGLALLSVFATPQEEDPTPIPGRVDLPESLRAAFDKRSGTDHESERASASFRRWLKQFESWAESRLRGAEPDGSALSGVRARALDFSDLAPEAPFETNSLNADYEGVPLTESTTLEVALGELLAQVGSAGRCATKITRTRLSESGASFDVRVELVGAEGESRVQVLLFATVDCSDLDPLRVDVFDVQRVEFDRGTPWFEDVTLSAFEGEASFERQLAYSLDHWSARMDQSLGMSLLGHEGLALGDVNGDGLEDLYVLQPGGLPNRLYLHQPDHTLRDVSAQAGVDYLDASHSALLVDLDGDGDRDLATVCAEEVLILSNEGGWGTEEGGRFELVRVLPGLSFFSLSAADFDSDGDLDLYGCAYSLPYWEDSIPIPYHDANNGRANSLYRNEGEFQFADVTVEVGLGQNNSRYSFAASWEDYDRDGDLDLYVANDFGRNNLYRNDEGRFRDVAAEAGVEDVSAGMGVDWADVDGDGWMDLLVSNMFSAAGGRIAYQRNFHASAESEIRELYQRHSRGNSLFRNRGDGTFEDITDTARVAMGRWAWGSVFGDWNNDGAQDIFVPNGFVTGEDDDDL